MQMVPRNRAVAQPKVGRRTFMQPAAPGLRHEACKDHSSARGAELGLREDLDAHSPV